MAEPKKLKKPYADFPLTPTSNGYWRKEINGRRERFGTRWCDPAEALEDYNLTREALKRGEPRPAESRPIPLFKACDDYLENELKRVATGDMKQRTWKDAKDEVDHMLLIMPARMAIHNLGPQHFAKLRESYTRPGISATTVFNRMTRAMRVFNWVQKQFNTQLNMGNTFVKPTAKAVREHKQKTAKGMIPPNHIRLLIEHAKNPQIKAMLWLAINCGFGNTDVGTLTLETLLRRFDEGWIEYPRPKTGMARAGKLWPETVDALRPVIGKRQKGLVFITKYGNPWSTDTKASAISAEVAKVRKKLIEKGEPLNPELNFYDCRRMFQTIAGNCLDEPAIDFIMGHVTDAKMSSMYTQGILDARLTAISDEVRRWLFSADHRTYISTKG